MDKQSLTEKFAAELKRLNPEAHLTAQQRLDLAFERAMRMTTPEHGGCPYDDPSHPKNHRNLISDNSDPNDGWI